ncbi:hypothetical protein AB6D66_01545 [Vibrio pomeroyi]|uniref:Uncharacterized protein n=1 Tax=Vibrio pomeroyi TaxID=198832 RepID=A0ABV4MRG6_9VIBR|nr:hypothetical protein [Vibrio atlanticus]MCZ4310192.1 hypothetical protein [Vibrio atlanticus]
MNEKSFTSLLLNKFESFETLPEAVKNELIYLFATKNIDLFVEGSEDVISWFKAHSLFEPLFKGATSDKVVLGFTEDAKHKVTIVNVWDGSYCVILDTYPIIASDYRDVATNVAAQLKASVGSIHEPDVDVLTSDLEAMGVDIDFWNYDDIAKWFANRQDQ